MLNGEGVMTKIRVLLADDQDIIRTGLTIILNHQADIEVIGQAADGLEAVEFAKRLHPDVILMDIKMPHLNGIQATRQIVAALPKTQIIILTTYDTDDWVFDGIRAGAIGYLLKDTSGDNLAEAVRGALRGESQIDPTVARKVLREFQQLDLAPLGCAAACGRRRTVGTVDRSRRRSPQVVGRWFSQQRNRATTLVERRHRQESHQRHPHQVTRQRPDAGRSHGLEARAGRSQITGEIMRIAIIASGSRGDIEPYLALPAFLNGSLNRVIEEQWQVVETWRG